MFFIILTIIFSKEIIFCQILHNYFKVLIKFVSLLFCRIQNMYRIRLFSIYFYCKFLYIYIIINNHKNRKTYIKEFLVTCYSVCDLLIKKVVKSEGQGISKGLRPFVVPLRTHFAEILKIY